ncbi:hypothetical protein [Ramlibacter montanisoli]|uniref:Sel1 repeat family protein n=1 Tax=Ramlibacter montanisoli TaxID=2732512 RepID=A0A849KIE0_9BURK|nr:hypothetical protein [Ramlibacter montanisoli]NNU44605.1 hypothetical protein [Ramlibacter montanisoli]
MVPQTPKFLKSLARALPLAACLLAGPALASDPAFDRAVESYHAGRMSDAYGRFMALAQGGDPDAARIVLFMGQYATMLFRTEWELTDQDNRMLRETAQRRSTRTFVPLEAFGHDSTGLRHARAVRESTGH